LRAFHVAACLTAALTVPCAQATFAADLKRGALLFQSCSACHSVLRDGIGPDIVGIYGQQAARRDGFSYSSAMKNSGIVWDDATLRAFVTNPQSVVKGTLMVFPGYAMLADVDNVVGYLKTLR
jgi:cytochrome c